jgi:hypothetical protein
MPPRAEDLHPGPAIEVYGLSVTGLDPATGAGPDRVDARPAADPQLHVTRRVGRALNPAEISYSDDKVVLSLIDEGQVVIEREPAVASYLLPYEISDDELLHPWLVPAVATISSWLGRRVLHGGLVGADGRAVALVADKEGGKSTLLSWLALNTDLDVLADDLVVVDGDTAFAGPRCIDLRRPTVDNLPVAGRVSVVRDGTRWRLSLPPAPPTVTLVGVVVLEWGQETGLHPVRPTERLAALLPHAIGHDLPPGRSGILGFASYPAWRLSRPKTWDALPASADLIRLLLREQ